MSEKTKSSLGVTLQTIMLGLGLYFLGRIIRNNFYYPFVNSLTISEGGKEVLTYLGHLVFLVILLVYLNLVKEESFMLKEFEFSSKRKDALWLIIGLIIGFVMNAISVLAAYLHGDIDMVPATFNPLILILLLLAIGVQSSVEEFEYRLFSFSRILNKAVLWYAVFGSALDFSLCHMLNSGITFLAFINITLVGIFYALAYYYTKSIWFSCAMHTAWNYTQNCIFGLPNSGNAAVATIWQPTFTKSSVCYDPEFGVEGTIVTTIVTIAAIVITILIGEKKKRNTSAVNATA